ncbi:PadR family transcriptional regulator [Streptomonospora mangrovi]|uniref:PadR family transcriptional regulator n=1 Tax=Streptomonospora mangrovi TaxID=2883123 RepID=UPI002FD836F3
MSTIFGHGRLRLYLLKLLDESPRHGYEIISLLRDRFLGVYSPSPGTIYPRLARLEEEGLVTHEEVNGRKVYRLTDKGREELRTRSSDLDDLEREITDSVRDVAQAVKEDVRHTISSLRQELKSAGRRPRGEDRRATGGAGSGAGTGAGAAGAAAGSAGAEGAEGASAPGADSGAGEGAGGSRSGSWWGRDWEKFATGFGPWGKRSSGERPEFDDALRDFTDRVRTVVREAGHVGESAAHDLRRILDDTIEVIRRDVAQWGPRESGADTGAQAPGTAAGPGAGDATGPAGGAERPGPDAPAGGGAAGAQAPPSDPWGAAVGEDAARPGTERVRDPGEGSGGAAGTGGATGSGAAQGDPWGTAVSEDPQDRPAGGGPDAAPPTGGPAEGTGTAGSPGDPWGTAVGEDADKDRRDGRGDGGAAG